MPPVSIILAWKDAEYRKSLGDKQNAPLRDRPVGLVELLDDDQESVAVAIGTDHTVN